MTRPLFVFLSVLGVAMAAQDRPARIAQSQVKDSVGKTVTVCGRVATYDCKAQDRASPLLYLEQSGRSKNVAVVVELPTATVPPRGADRYVLRDICATGLIEERNGEYLVRVDDPADLRVEREPQRAAFGAGIPRSCNEGVEPPKAVQQVRGTYTSDAMRGKIQGTVLLEAVVQADGSVGDVRVVRSLGRGLDQQAVTALKAWRFQPGTRGGQAVPAVMTVGIPFTLR